MAKGLEWEAVFVLHAVDGNIPSDLATRSNEEIEEERRLFYVALTRARSHLDILQPQRYYFHAHHNSDRHSYAQRTRFLPDEILSRFEQVTFAPTTLELPANDAPAVLTSAEVRKKIGRMWA